MTLFRLLEETIPLVAMAAGIGLGVWVGRGPLADAGVVLVFNLFVGGALFGMGLGEWISVRRDRQ